MWFHHVRQSPDAGGRTIAINYCKDHVSPSPLRFQLLYDLLDAKVKTRLLQLAGYDMQFDIKYAYFDFLQSVHYRSTHSPTLPETVSEDSKLEAD